MADEGTVLDFGGVLLQRMDRIDHKAIECGWGCRRRRVQLPCRDSRYFELHVGGCTHDEWVESVRSAT
jgi:hypothetical protein